MGLEAFSAIHGRADGRLLLRRKALTNVKGITFIFLPFMGAISRQMLEREQAQFARGNMATGQRSDRGVPNWPAVTCVQSLVPAIHGEADAAFPIAKKEARVHSLEAETAVMFERD